MNSQGALDQRHQILTLLDRGLTVAQVSQRLGCSRTTVYKVVKRKVNNRPLVDERRGRAGRIPSIKDGAYDAVRQIRADNRTYGPMMIHNRLTRNPSAYGLTHTEIPSPASIGRLIQREGLAYKPIGPGDTRRYPIHTPATPGAVSIDTWGPWNVRAERLYLATVIDRHTRLAAAVPASNVEFTPDGKAKPGVTAQIWARAVAVARHFLVGELTHVVTDNGVGMIPSLTGLPLAPRLVLHYGAHLIYIPPAQPWRNGVLERFHWSMEREYWREERPTSLAAATDGLTDFLNYYNLDRPHYSLKYRAPAEACGFGPELPAAYWTQVDPPRRLEPQPGTVSAVRLVYNDGTIDTWGQTLQVSPLLAGQYVIVQFQVTGQRAHGSVLYRPKRDVEVLVATFTHDLDAPARGGTAWQLYHDIELHEFAGEAPANERLDEEQLANQLSRVLKRRSRLDVKLAGDD